MSRILPLAEFEALARRVKSGDKSAERELYEGLVSLAESAAGTGAGRAARHRGVGWDDLKQEAMLAMWKALESWEPSRGAFRTYAFDRSRYAMMNAANSAYPLYIGRGVAEEARARANGRPPKENGPSLTPETVRRALAAMDPSNVVSLQGYVNAKGGDSDTQNDECLAGYEEDYEAVEREEEYCRLRRAISTMLDKRQRRVLKLRFEQGMTFDKIGEEFGVSGQAIHSVYTRALKKLRTGIPARAAG